MPRAANTRELIVDKAFQLMLQRGIKGFSYRDISEPLGIKNAAIHYHFPNKMDLVKELIHENHEILKRGTAEFMAYGGPARPQLEGMFGFVLHQCDCGRPICMVGALAIDYDDLPDDVKQVNDVFMGDSLKWLTRVVELGRDQGEFDFRGDPESKAATILATVQGARQIARVHGPKFLDRVFDQVRNDLGIES